MHSTLASIGREADILLCAQKEDSWSNLARFFLGLHVLSITADFGLFFAIGPQSYITKDSERQRPESSLDLNEQVCLNDQLARRLGIITQWPSGRKTL